MSAKNKFQVERIILFTDAVFAIIITLMVIEVKPPHLHQEENAHSFLSQFSTVLPNIIGTILSFILIGKFWINHHKYFKHLIKYDNKLLILNLCLLLSLAFIPFCTGFVFDNILAKTNLPLIIYNINYIIVSIFNWLLVKHIYNPKHSLCDNYSSYEMKEENFHTLFSILIFTLVIVISCFTPIAAAFYSLFGLMDICTKKFVTQQNKTIHD